MQVLIRDIIVRKRIRKDVGDLEGLAESLKRFGLINPITINKNNVLIAGERRLEAAKQLGWRTINAVISESIDELDRLRLEVEENVQRSDFNIEEVAEATKRMYRLQNPGFFRRILNAILHYFKWLFKIRDA
jgi:ParB family chromosome partitioning protein